MAHKKPVGWRREPGRHSLAAKGIKTGRAKGVTMAQIRSGYARNKYGLDTSSGSRYAKLRENGYSDEEAQAIIYGVGREEAKPGIGVPLSLPMIPVKQAKVYQKHVMRSLGTLAEKAQEGRMNMMTGPRIAEAARHIENQKFDRAISMLNEVAGLGPSEVTRKAKDTIQEIKRLKTMWGMY